MKDRAKSILEAKQVRILIENQVPPEAVVVLGKGLGFVPTPKVDVEELRLDGRRLSNKIAALDNVNSTNSSNLQTNDNFIPYKLNPINYSAPSSKIKNPLISQSIDAINTKLNAIDKSLLPKNPKKNLSPLEIKGLRWLENKTSNLEIVITQADKGGSILIVPPNLMENKIKEKVNNSSLYEHIEKDPRYQMYDDIFELWKEGKKNKFVTPDEAYKVVGITKENNKSTSSYFKPGTTFFTPSLKIHKMDNIDIKPGCNPPARLISSLQDGITKRTDVFIANKWLKSLEADFCTDLVKDTNSTLIWLDSIDKSCSNDVKRNLKPFTFDFEALYDSLTPDLVLESIKFAICECRPNWSKDLTDWILKNVEYSMKFAIGLYKGKWYRPIKGIPTGGSLSVEMANIAVFYVLQQTLYKDESLMNNIHSMKRFIDDEAGLFKGSLDDFTSWKTDVNRGLNIYNLNVKDDDWDIVSKNQPQVHFLDVKFGFNLESKLVTDIYVKDTDAKGFLNFNSCHPNHTFSSIVYSQALRYRRIINDDELLKTRLMDLKNYFKLSNYPNNMVDNIIDKVANLPRLLEIINTDTSSTDRVINVISTFGRDDVLCKIAESVSQTLISNKVVSKFEYTKKTAPSLRNKLCNSKYISLDKKYGTSTSCKRPRCKNCKLMSEGCSINDSNGKKHKTAKGTCTSSNIIYAATCKLCLKNYTGKSTQLFSNRNNGHRAKFVKYVKHMLRGGDHRKYILDDEYSLGIHLYNEHQLIDRKGFDNTFKFTVLENCSPRNLDEREHSWIQKLRCLYPHGLNLISPFGLPLLD